MYTNIQDVYYNLFAYFGIQLKVRGGVSFGLPRLLITQRDQTMAFILQDKELEALTGVDYMLYVIYLHLRQHMDYASGIVGIKRGISYQSISEALYIEPRAGVKGGSPHKSSIRRALDQLEKTGIIRRGNNPDNLVFKLPFAVTDKNGLKKADTNPTPHPDTVKALSNKAHKTQADTPKNRKADTPPLSDKNIHITTTTENKLLSTDQNLTAGSSSNLIFSKTLDQETKQGMSNIIKGFDIDTQQLLLDEVQGYIELKKIQSTPQALLIGLVERCKVGAFIPNYAIKVQQRREQRKADEAPKAAKSVSNKTSAATIEGLNNVRAMFKKKAAV